MILSFRDLEDWQEGFRLQIDIDELIQLFPQQERFLLCDQMRRASRGIPAIIAEGWSKRESIKEFQKYLRDAIAEANEMINHLLLTKHKQYIKKRGVCG